MRMLLDNGSYQLRNMGDVAMLQVAVRRLRELWPGVEMATFTEEPGRLAEFCPDVAPIPLVGRRLWMQERNVFGGFYNLLPRAAGRGLERIECGIRHRWPDPAERWIEHRLGKRGIDTRSMKDFLTAVRQADVVAACGGGYITDAFEDHAVAALETLYLGHTFGKPTALFGQGIGPITTPRLRAQAKATFSVVDLIAVRESTSALEVLDSMDVRPAQVIDTGDDAVELAYRERPPDLGTCLGMNVRVAFYSDVVPEHIDKVCAAVKEVAGKHSATVLSVPIARHEGDSDVEAAQKYLGEVAADTGEELDTPLRVIHKVGRCRVVVTGSYHGGVFALAQGIPVVGLAQSAYYRNKFLGLAAHFGEGCQVLAFGCNGFRANLVGAIDKAWDSAERLRPRLLEAAECQIQLGHKAYRLFHDLVMSGQGTT